MSFNGSGVFVINSAGQPVVATTLITAAAMNALTADLATGLSTCIAKDGQTTVTANLPMSTFKITGMGDGTALQDAATLKNLQNATGIYVATVGGTANDITLTPTPAITAYAAGQTFRFIASGANTTAVTVAVSGLTAKDVRKNGTQVLIAGDIAAGAMVEITYDGSRFIIGTTSDYQQGTWTPAVGGDATYTLQQGAYTKIGRLVTINCRLTINVLGTGSAINITGIPFAPQAGSKYNTGAVVWASAASSLVACVANLPEGTSTITLYGITAANATLGSAVAVLGNSASVGFSLSYMV